MSVACAKGREVQQEIDSHGGRSRQSGIEPHPEGEEERSIGSNNTPRTKGFYTQACEANPRLCD